MMINKSEIELQAMSLQDLNRHMVEVRDQDPVDQAYESLVNQIRRDKGLPAPVIISTGRPK